MRIKNLTADVRIKDGNAYFYFSCPVADYQDFIKQIHAIPRAKKQRVVKHTATLKERKDGLFNVIVEWKKVNPGKYPSRLYAEFMKYWGMASKKGTSTRYDDQDYWETGPRLATFWKMVSDKDKNDWWELDKNKNG